jgi:UDP:flavonoid glycosyltransferase YjiC (YdhE family)
MIDPLVNNLRREHGLEPIRDAVFGAHSPTLNLQLYSRQFAAPAPDWSAEKRQAGFCFYDPPSATLSPQIEEFLRTGDRPVLFTLGSTASRHPGAFYEMAAAVCRRMGIRGLLLVGAPENRPRKVPTNVLVAGYAPYGLIVPRVRAVVHQCGIGTLSHALRAGVPSVAVPFAFDQPNNACRLEELGVAELVKPAVRNVETVARAIERLLAGPAAAKAERLGRQIRAEDGVASACSILEKSFSGSR